LAVARIVVIVTAIAAVVLCAGCGGSGSKTTGTKSAGGLPVGGARQEVSARQGAFRTVVPFGFAYTPSASQYYAVGPTQLIGPGHEGEVINLVVIREPVVPGDANALAGRLARTLRRQRNVHNLLGPVALSVGGVPALAVDYGQSEGKKGEAHYRQIFVRHGKWVYIIQMGAPAAKEAAASGALEEVVNNWRWQ
jgi:hypothetical protein